MSSSKRRPAVLWLWYRGQGFVGFQSQPAVRTVQGTLLEGLSSVGIPTGIMPAGRTDRGVHARMQVISLRLPGSEDPSTLPSRLAAVLPPDLGVAAAAWAPKGFHAQWSAEGKEYRFRFAPGGTLPTGWEGCAWASGREPRLLGRPPDPARLEEALRWMVGARDFFAFHESSSPRRVRTLEEASLHRPGTGALWEVRLRGDGFGRYMVRYLVGAAVAYACSALEAQPLQEALEHAVPFAGLKAPGEGLILWEVRYPPRLSPFARPEIALPSAPPFD